LKYADILSNDASTGDLRLKIDSRGTILLASRGFGFVLEASFGAQR
jgi:hypothetical protein